MNVVRSYHDVMKLGKKSSVIIWGAGALGSDLVCELDLAGYHDFYISDTKYDVIKEFDNRIASKHISYIFRKNSTSIVLAVRSDNAVNEIAEYINKIWREEKEKCNVEIYRYIPETPEELIARRQESGFFVGGVYKKALDTDDAVALLKRKITGTQPFLFARWGTIEGDAVYKMKAGRQLSQNERLMLQKNAGVFPAVESIIKAYCEIMEGAAEKIDILSVFYWQKNLERWIEWYSQKAAIVGSELQYPFFSNPWTKALEGMKVLVIHPFANLIEKQYKKRDILFKNDEVLPEFDLKTYQAVQSLGGNCEYRDWVQALNIMQADISNIDFDIALIGCGAYGMPLGGFIKSELQKKAIHMGGSLQILFGIKGRRWEANGYDYQHKLYNEYWVRPTDDLKPPDYKEVEDGCYW